MPPTTCVPVRDLKNTSQFTKTVQEASGPVIVTKNGEESFVSMSMDVYESLCQDEARLRLYESIDRAERDIAAGRTTDLSEVLDDLRKRYDL